MPMKTILPLVLWAVCASAWSLTINEIAGKWVVDMKATWPQLEPQFRLDFLKALPGGVDGAALDAKMEEIRHDMADRVIEITEKKVSVYRRDENAKGHNEDIEITSLTADKETLTITSSIVGKEITLTMSRRGDLLVMESHTAIGLGGQVRTTTIILKRPAAAAPAPVASPAAPSAPAPAAPPAPPPKP